MVRLVNPQPLSSVAPLDHVVWAALEKVGKKQLKANQLVQGTSHDVSLQIRGNVDGQPFEQTVNSVVSVGFEQTKSSSVNPQVPQLIALILGKLNRATRERILSDVPREFSENGNQLPESNPVLLDDSSHLLKQLRQSRTVTSRGAIRCEFTL